MQEKVWYTTSKNMEYLESTMETLLFDISIFENDSAPTINKYCDFDATLTRTVKIENANCNARN